MIRGALIGCGYWGRNILRVLSEMDGFDLRVVCDAKKPMGRIPRDVEFKEDYRAVLKDGKIDCVFIATPASTHYEIAREFLESKRHVFVEKPLTTDITSAQELCSIAEKQKVQLMVGEVFRFNEGIKYIKRMIDNRELGEIRYIEARRVGLGPVRNDVSVLWDLASHDIYICNLFVGKEPFSVNCRGVSHNGVSDDISCLNLIYPTPNVLATIYVNWEHPVIERKVIVGGTEKAVLFDDIEASEKVRIYNKGIEYQAKNGDFGAWQAAVRDGDIVIPKLKLTQPLEEELRHFIECVEGREKCLSDGYEGAKTVKVLEVAETSRKNKGLEIRMP